jgi:hypothetical protein
MPDAGADLLRAQPGAVQLQGGRVQPLQVPVQAAHGLVPNLHGSEVAVVDQRQVPQLAGRRGVPVDFGPHDAHRPTVMAAPVPANRAPAAIARPAPPDRVPASASVTSATVDNHPVRMAHGLRA